MGVDPDRSGCRGDRDADALGVQRDRERRRVRGAEAGRRHRSRHRPGPRRPSSARHRVIADGTASAMQTMMAQVVNEGTGEKAAVPGYQAAGKTGTARIPQQDHAPDNSYLDAQGRYHYMSSFGGFVVGADLSILIVMRGAPDLGLRLRHRRPGLLPAGVVGAASLPDPAAGAGDAGRHVGARADLRRRRAERQRAARRRCRALDLDLDLDVWAVTRTTDHVGPDRPRPGPQRTAARAADDATRGRAARRGVLTSTRRSPGDRHGRRRRHPRRPRLA